jgi:sulfur-carrier protein
MRVKVRLFAQLRDLAGGGDLDCVLADETAKAEAGAGAPMQKQMQVQDVWRAVVRDHPALASFTRAMSTAVNLEYARLDTPVRDGDEVAFLPPVSGG